MKVAMYDLEGYLLEIFETDTIVDLEKRLKIKQGSLNYCIQGANLTANDKQFRQVVGKHDAKKKIGDVSDLSTQRFRPVHKYYKGKYICSYDSTTKAGKKNRVDYNSIIKCCTGERKTAGGFEWKYEN